MPRSAAPTSEVVEALMARLPHWMLRSGTGLIACGCLLLIGFAAFLRYPDVVRGTAQLTTARPPVPIQSGIGQIEVLQVAEGDAVAAQQVLAVLSQDLPFARVGQMQVWVDVAVAALSKGELPTAPPRPSETLGDLQAPYSALLAAWDACKLQQTYDLSAQDQMAAQQRLQILGQRSDRLRGQDSLLAEKLRIATALFEADSALWAIGSASWLEVQAARERKLNAEDEYAVAQAAIFDRALLATATTQNIYRLGLEQARNVQDLEGNLWRSLVALGAAIGEWEDRHLLRAPFAGVVTFDTPPAVGQQLSAGQTFGWLIPQQAGPRFARVRIPAMGAGKVEKGQEVLIALADYPRGEYGILMGDVVHVAPLLIDGQYTVDVQLPDDLQTTLGHRLPLRSEAIGQAEIITRDRSLLQRIFSPFSGVLGR
jgi:hypothetical protein